MRDTLKKLEAEARKLEPGAERRAQWQQQTAAYAEGFLEGLADGKTYQRDDGTGAGFQAGIDESPTAMNQLLELLAMQVDKTGVNPASGGHLGYIPGGGIFPAALGDFLADVFNRYSGISFASPGAARMEQSLVEWMTQLVGYPETAGGDLTSGGSMANLGAVVTARDAMGIHSADVANSCIYLTRQVHHCVDKALRVAGLGEARVRYVPMDRLHRMNVTELEGLIQADRELGLKPWLVVASAGTTDTGAVDPLVEIGQVCERQGMWFHLDAAYGGFFVLCEEGREMLQGMSLADSIVMDPHKGLFLPYGSGALLVKDVRHLARAHAYDANYMQDARQTATGYSPADLSVELSRPFRGMRLWLPLRLFGLQPFRAALAEKMHLARYFHQQLSAQPGWEIGPVPDLSVMTYRYIPRQGDTDAFNRRLLAAVHDDGRVFISSTLLNGCFVLRLAVLHFRTHLETVDYLLTLLLDTAKRLESEQA